MDYKVFYRKYRPKNFNQLIGQDNVKEILINSIKLNKIAHAYIFTGPRGTGKTSTAKIFAKTLNCLSNSNGISCDECEQCVNYNESADIIEIDAASNNGVEEIRLLRDSVKILPYNSKYKIYIIDEVHMLSNSAWNAFLKTLEEPPSHVIFILATTEVNKIPETVMSRCQRFDFYKINNEVMEKSLLSICKEENINIDNNALNEIIKLSDGCMRDALSYLDQISKFSKDINVEIIEKNFGILTKTKFDKLFTLIKNNDKKSINSLINEINNSGITPLNFINNFIDYLLDIMLTTNTDEKVIKKIIYDLNNLVLTFNSIVNPFTLIKTLLISENYFPGNNFVDISQEIIGEKKKLNNDNNNINNNDINEEKVADEIIIDNNKIKFIRINNSFVGASKECKKQFIELWDKLIQNLNVENKYNILGYIENSDIEVVSETNVIFSLKTESEMLIFNQNLYLIEQEFNELNNLNYKFIALSKDEWLKEKNEYISNKTKKYTYINEEENIIEEDVKSKSLAENIFGNDIIEIR
ncbi:MAG: DNA polymerase III subunit gamma/tau [Bacilli bacterium]|nr:DNA polymerase III subunit gamma/tau [Bacilli bacterium]